MLLEKSYLTCVNSKLEPSDLSCLLYALLFLTFKSLAHSKSPVDVYVLLFVFFETEFEMVLHQ